MKFPNKIPYKTKKIQIIVEYLGSGDLNKNARRFLNKEDSKEINLIVNTEQLMMDPGLIVGKNYKLIWNRKKNYWYFGGEALPKPVDKLK